MSDKVDSAQIRRRKRDPSESAKAIRYFYTSRLLHEQCLFRSSFLVQVIQSFPTPGEQGLT